MTTLACSSVNGFVGTGVLASANVPFTLRAALIVDCEKKSVSRFSFLPRPGEGQNVLFAHFFSKEKVVYSVRVLPAGIRINEHLGQTFSTFLSGSAIVRFKFHMCAYLCSHSSANAFTHRGVVIPLPCGKWSCPECARTLAKEWAIRVKLGIGEDVAYFWTLTMSGKVRTPAYAFEILPSLWDVFRKRMQRTRGKWSYVAFIEGQPKRSNMPHFHIISMEKAPMRLKDLAVLCGFGYQAWDEKVKDKRAAHYTAKYLTKQSPVTPEGFKRVRHSQDWPKLPDIDILPLLIKKRGEFWLDYFMRVSDTCNLSITEVIDRWCDSTGMSFDNA